MEKLCVFYAWITANFFFTFCNIYNQMKDEIGMECNVTLAFLLNYAPFNQQILMICNSVCVIHFYISSNNKLFIKVHAQSLVLH